MRKHTGAALFIIALLISVLLPSCDGQKSFELCSHFKKGDLIKIRSSTEQLIKQVIMGQTHEISQKMRLNYEYLIDEVDSDGNALVKVTYTEIYFMQQGPMGTVEYDSVNPPQEINPIVLGFSCLPGQGFTMKLSPRGNVSDIRGIDALITLMLKKANLPDDLNRAELERSLKEQFGEEALKQTMESITAVLPEKPVKVGDSWERKIVISRGFPMILDNRWTLKGLKDGRAAIEICSIVSENKDAPPLDLGIMKIKYELKGSQTGSTLIQNSGALYINTTIKQKFSGTVKIVESPQLPEDMSWPITVESEVHYETY